MPLENVQAKCYAVYWCALFVCGNTKQQKEIVKICTWSFMMYLCGKLYVERSNARSKNIFVVYRDDGGNITLSI